MDGGGKPPCKPTMPGMPEKLKMNLLRLLSVRALASLAKVMFNVAWRSLTSLWETMFRLAGAGVHAGNKGSAADAKRRSEGL